jgi:hypothetical protein
MTEQSKDWDGITLEEAVRHAVRTCTLEQIALLLRLIPDGPKKDFYRQVVKDEAGKMRGGC